MFGVERNGHARIRRIIKRSNSERKLPGPVVLGINTLNISPATITIWWNGARVVEPTVLKTLIDPLELQAGTISGSQPTTESPEEFFAKKARAA
jgi:hypothetical protein